MTGTWSTLALVPALVLVWSLAAIHGPTAMSWLRRELRHRADLRRVTEAGR